MRVTGGVFRSRALRAPRGTTTRPTSDRVREAIFSMLVSDGLIEEGARVLDLYAGGPGRVGPCTRKRGCVAQNPPADAGSNAAGRLHRCGPVPALYGLDFSYTRRSPLLFAVPSLRPSLNGDGPQSTPPFEACGG